MSFYYILSAVIAGLSLVGVVMLLLSFQQAWRKKMDYYLILPLLLICLLNMVMVVVGMEMDLPKFNATQQDIYNLQQMGSYACLIEFALLMMWNLLRQFKWQSFERFIFSVTYLIGASIAVFTHLNFAKLI